MITNTIIVWNISVERIFLSEGESSTFNKPILALAIANRVMSAALKLYLEYRRSEDILTLKSTLHIISKEMFCLFYCILGLCDFLFHSAIMLIL